MWKWLTSWFITPDSVLPELREIQTINVTFFDRSVCPKLTAKGTDTFIIDVDHTNGGDTFKFIVMRERLKLRESGTA